MEQKTMEIPGVPSIYRLIFKDQIKAISIGSLFVLLKQLLLNRLGGITSEKY